MSQQALPQTCHYSSDDVKIIEKSAGYNGFFKVNVYRLQHRLFAGGWNAPIVRELFERGHAAALLPYDPVRDEIVLVEQFRIGAMETSATPGCWSWWPASSMKGRPPRQWCGAKRWKRLGSRWDAANTPSAIW